MPNLRHQVAPEEVWKVESIDLPSGLSSTAEFRGPDAEVEAFEYARRRGWATQSIESKKLYQKEFIEKLFRSHTAWGLMDECSIPWTPAHEYSKGSLKFV